MLLQRPPLEKTITIIIITMLKFERATTTTETKIKSILIKQRAIN